jgi:pimeloyl-ACP methyl ester carboxylesterase
VLLAWATQDRFFPVELAHRLEALLPQASFAGIDDSYTFIPEDQPDVLTDLIVTFARSHAQT